MTERLYRHPTDRVIAGVAAGLAAWMHVDPSLVRIAWVVLAIMSGGILVLVYLVMMIVVPLPPAGWVPGSGPAPWAGGAPGPGAMPGWQPPAGGPGAVPGWQAPDSGAGWQDSSTTTGWDAGSAGGAAPQPGQPPQAPGAQPQPAWTPVATQRGPSNAGIVVGAVLVLLGLWFFVQRYVRVDWDLLWPVVVIGLGVVLIAGAMRRHG